MCLASRPLHDTTVVLVGGQAASEPAGFFVARAGRIRDALIARGVDLHRIVIGATNASREGGLMVGDTGVRIEVTHWQQVRGFVPSDTGVRAAQRSLAPRRPLQRRPAGAHSRSAATCP